MRNWYYLANTVYNAPPAKGRQGSKIVMARRNEHRHAAASQGIGCRSPGEADRFWTEAIPPKINIRKILTRVIFCDIFEVEKANL